MHLFVDSITLKRNQLRKFPCCSLGKLSTVHRPTRFGKPQERVEVDLCSSPYIQIQQYREIFFIIKYMRKVSPYKYIDIQNIKPINLTMS